MPEVNPKPYYAGQRQLLFNNARIDHLRQFSYIIMSDCSWSQYIIQPRGTTNKDSYILYPYIKSYAYNMNVTVNLEIFVVKIFS